MQEDDTFPVKCLLGHFQAHWVRINTRSSGAKLELAIYDAAFITKLRIGIS